jgi:transcription antitermination factor NusG
MPTHVPVIVDELFGNLEPAPAGSQWLVVHTKPRCEKKLASYSKDNGITYYLPQMESSRIYQKRKVTFTKPMFPGYLFTVLDHAKKQTLTISGLTVSFIRVFHQDHLLSELRNIHISRKVKQETREALWLSKGLEVELVTGPLKGMRGVVEDHSKLDEIRLQVNILRQAVIVKVKSADVKILGEYEIVEE